MGLLGDLLMRHRNRDLNGPKEQAFQGSASAKTLRQKHSSSTGRALGDQCGWSRVSEGKKK